MFLMFKWVSVTLCDFRLSAEFFRFYEFVFIRAPGELESIVPTASSPKVSAVAPPVSSSRIAVFVADDTPMGCQLLENALKRSGNQFHIVACRVAKSDIINYMRTHNVDVALINEDLQDGRFTGLEAAREVHVSCPENACGHIV